MKKEMPPEARLVRTFSNQGEAIAWARRRMGMTQSDLASAVGVSQSAVTDWETGKTKPRVSMFGKLEGVLGGPDLVLDMTGGNFFGEKGKVDLSEGKIEEPSFKTNVEAFNYICTRIEVHAEFYDCYLNKQEFALIASRVWTWHFADPSNDQPVSGQQLETSIVSDITAILERRRRRAQGDFKSAR